MAPRTPDRTAPDITATLGPGEKSDELWLALRALPAGQRRVVVLRNYWGLSIAETANDLGVGIGTVKSQTSAALASLRRNHDPTLLWPASRAVLRKPSEHDNACSRRRRTRLD